MYKYASSSSHLFAPVNGATSFFAHCTAFFRSLGETEDDRAERADAVTDWSAILNGKARETLSRLTLALSRQLHALAVKAYADNFLESDIPTLRRLSQLPTCSPATFALFYREEDDVYSNPVDDPRYVTIDEVIKNIMYHQEV